MLSVWPDHSVESSLEAEYPSLTSIHIWTIQPLEQKTRLVLPCLSPGKQAVMPICLMYCPLIQNVGLNALLCSAWLPWCCFPSTKGFQKNCSSVMAECGNYYKGLWLLLSHVIQKANKWTLQKLLQHSATNRLHFSTARLPLSANSQESAVFVQG